MSELRAAPDVQRTSTTAVTDQVKPGDKPVWEKPVLEDVSEQVMAQPYIRFT